MIRILLVTEQKENFNDLIGALEKRGDVEIQLAGSGEKAMTMAREVAYELVIADESVGDMKGLFFIEKLVRMNPMLNTAAVSPLSGEDFHEASEGLGVLGHLPVRPQEKDARSIMEKLEAVMNLTAKRGV